jgi:hypothetical protein
VSTRAEVELIQGTQAKVAVYEWPSRDPRHIVILAHGYGEHLGGYDYVAVDEDDVGALGPRRVALHVLAREVVDNSIKRIDSEDDDRRATVCGPVSRRATGKAPDLDGHAVAGRSAATPEMTSSSERVIHPGVLSSIHSRARRPRRYRLPISCRRAAGDRIRPPDFG